MCARIHHQFLEQAASWLGELHLPLSLLVDDRVILIAHLDPRTTARRLAMVAASADQPEFDNIRILASKNFQCGARGLESVDRVFASAVGTGNRKLCQRTRLGCLGNVWTVVLRRILRMIHTRSLSRWRRHCRRRGDRRNQYACCAHGIAFVHQHFVGQPHHRLAFEEDVGRKGNKRRLPDEYATGNTTRTAWFITRTLDKLAALDGRGHTVESDGRGASYQVGAHRDIRIGKWDWARGTRRLAHIRNRRRSNRAAALVNNGKAIGRHRWHGIPLCSS